VLVSEFDLTGLFRIITEVIVQEFQADRLSLMLIDEAGRRAHDPRLPWPSVRTCFAGAKAGRKCPGSLSHGNPFIISNGRHPDPEVMQALNRENMPVSSMSVPLMGRNKVIRC
jgi:hypothetical protein